MMHGSDCKLIYCSKDYYRKRLKVLEKENYIRRVNRVYIKLDVKGTKLVKEFGYNYSFKCRDKSYIDRLKEISKIAALSINSNIEFIPSWDLKDSKIFTQNSRKYIGELKYDGIDRIAYYISKQKKMAYTSQIKNDIKKINNHKNIVIFMEDIDIINKKNKFVFGFDSLIVINPMSLNLQILRNYEDIDFYKIVQNIYKDKEILLSNWKDAEYMLENKRYIVVMPFIDTEKIYRLNVFLRKNPRVERKVDLITLKGNKEKIKEILTYKVNVLEIDYEEVL